MRRTRTYLAIGSGAVLWLTACGGSTPPAASEGPSATAPKTAPTAPAPAEPTTIGEPTATDLSAEAKRMPDMPPAGSRPTVPLLGASVVIALVLHPTVSLIGYAVGARRSAR